MNGAGTSVEPYIWRAAEFSRSTTRVFQRNDRRIRHQRHTHDPRLRTCPSSLMDRRHRRRSRLDGRLRDNTCHDSARKRDAGSRIHDGWRPGTASTSPFRPKRPTAKSAARLHPRAPAPSRSPRRTARVLPTGRSTSRRPPMKSRPSLRTIPATPLTGSSESKSRPSWFRPRPEPLIPTYSAIGGTPGWYRVRRYNQADQRYAHFGRQWHHPHSRHELRRFR